MCALKQLRINKYIHKCHMFSIYFIRHLKYNIDQQYFMQSIQLRKSHMQKFVGETNVLYTKEQQYLATLCPSHTLVLQVFNVASR